MCSPGWTAHGLTAANNNGSGQIVAAGTKEQLASLVADPPARARLIELSVAGAFHTVHMEPAVARLEALARAISTHDPRTRLLSNTDGQVVHDGREVLRRLVGQVAAPVRWDLCMSAMSDLGVTGLLEMPPSGTLTGIAKRNLKGVELFALNTPDQLEEAMEFVQKHGGAAAASPIAGNPTWRLIVSPGKGQFVRTEDVEADDDLAQPQHRRDGQEPPGRNAGQRASRWHRRRVACRGWRSGLPWSAAASAAPDCRIRRRNRGHPMMLKVTPGAKYSAILGSGWLSATSGGRQR